MAKEGRPPDSDGALAVDVRPGDRANPALRVVIATSGKFHFFDLARQLHKRSVLTAIFTGYPHFKLTREHIPKNLVYTFPWIHAPYMRFPHAIFGNRLKRDLEWWDSIAFEWYVSRHLPDCDVFHALSSSGLNTGLKAQKFGAKYICERASSHIRFQDRILREEHDRQGITFAGIDPRIIEREEAEYQAADAVTVPSHFVSRSFMAQGVPAEKINVIPFGVDLARFSPVAQPDSKMFDVLFVGAVSVRKGIPYLLKAFEKLDHPHKRLTLIGSSTPELNADVLALAARRDDIRVLGPIPQEQLPQFMSRAHVMVLPSLEEGLAFVQAQTMACRCPVIATTNTGAEDLFTNGIEGFIEEPRNVDALTQRMQELADNPELRERMAAAALAKVQHIGGWDLYGEKMYRLYCTLSG